MPRFFNIAIPVPMRQTFTYRLPERLQEQSIEVGARVLVPFGNRSLIGVVLSEQADCELDAEKIKDVQGILPAESHLNAQQVKFLLICARYYHHPVGDVFSQALPVLLRQTNEIDLRQPLCWQVDPQLSPEQLQEKLASIAKTAIKQKALFSLLQKQGAMTWPQIRLSGFTKSQLNALINRQLLVESRLPNNVFQFDENVVATENRLQLTTEQALVVSQITQHLNQFSCHLIDGITGSGKTEVYLQVMEKVLEQNQQVLVIVPEIGLTPQTLHRFEQRFNVPIMLHHSGLNDGERLQTWQSARLGSAAIVLATRSGVFTPMPNLGLIIVDEEHDASLKQQEGFRYHCRDLAILRAQQQQLPVILGSATPSLESLHNAKAQRYHYHQLTQRPGSSKLATMQLVDVSTQPLVYGLSAQVQKAMQATLEKGEQVLLFLNRRGFAPAISCQECHWISECQRCNRPFTFHHNQQLLVCHHCGNQKRVERQCQNCGSVRIKPLGQGTEQLEQRLEELFPQFNSVRIDRDSTRRKGELEKHLEAIANNEYQILVGTQMLAKGHHFPNVTLVVMLDVDGALFSYDFRAPEKMAQLLVQVAGRAGRASKPGHVLIQTHYPQHPLLQDLINNGYEHFARFALMERQQAMMPPFTFQALIRAEANHGYLPEQFLRDITAQITDSDCAMCGPVAAPMEKKAGKFRYHLTILGKDRQSLHKTTNRFIHYAEQHADKNKVRWHVDIDPQDMSW
ncbi:primosomal protein N' [Thalassotalea sp. PS06]|uniref:primosomal protein N' n=1 Tax=Thalassotalea sp. PS06 TaxID=2594005 RepID=UPI001163659C|nr:primosomal protein N' [Thalassotalea sp. PS06]QDP02866.1 primosomal protein N' [Thalassotalea sp. PS06]